MISSVRGTVLAAGASNIEVEVGGVGLSITVTPRHAMSLRIGSEAMVRTALIVRDDDLALFGFAESEELETFDLLRGVTGVGPKSAIGVLAAMSPAEIADAVAEENDSAFRKVSGIGPKTAKLIVLSLAGKIQARPAAGAPTNARFAPARDNVVAALTGLGWPERVAMQTVDEVMSDAGAQPDVPALLRLALSRLGPRQGSHSGERQPHGDEGER